MDGKQVFSCEDDDFMVRGRDEEEIMMIARMHLKDRHNMEITDEDLKAKIKMETI